MAKLKKESRQRALILLVLGLFLAMFVLINAQEFIVGAFVYIVMGGLSIFLYTQWGKLGAASDLEGIDKNWVKDGLVGIGLGIATIALSSIIPTIGAIGLPPVQSIAGILGRFILVVPCAMIFEEVFFRDKLMDFLDSKLKFPKIPSIIITAIAFSAFHLAVYGETLEAVGGSFLSAAIMGFIFGIVTELQNSLAGSITYHGTLNIWLGFIKEGGLVVV